MSIDTHRGIATAAQLAAITDARLDIATGRAVREEITRTGDRPPISRWIRTLVHKRDNWTCVWCGDSPWAASEDRQADLLNVDHVIPWSAGGSDRTDNLRTLCAGCNRFRSNYTADMRSYSPTPIVRACDICRDTVGDPAVRFLVYCASLHHVTYSTDERFII